MHVQVNALRGDLNYFVKPKTTIETICNKVAQDVGLKDTNFFGLQAYNQENQTWHWIQPKKHLRDLVHEKIEPIICLRFRARCIPSDFIALKHDRAVMRLLYWQIEENWGKMGYTSGRAIDECLLSMHLLIELGPLALVIQFNERSKLVEVVKQYLLLDELEVLEQSCEKVLQIWQMFGDMPADDAVFNFIELALYEYKAEMLRFDVKNQYNELVNMMVAYEGLGFNINHDDYDFFEWASVRKVSRRDKSVILKLRDPVKLRYKCNNKYEAKRIWASIVSYHKVHLLQKYSNQHSGVLLAFSPQWLQAFVNQVTATSSTAMPVEEMADSKDLTMLIRKLDCWMAENEEKASQLKATLQHLRTLCVEMQLLHSGQGLQANNKVELMAGDHTPPVPQGECQEKPAEDEYNVEESSNTELHNEEEEEREENKGDVAQTEPDNGAEGDLEKAMEDGGVQEQQTTEFIRRKRFTKLRLSLFEHHRF